MYIVWGLGALPFAAVTEHCPAPAAEGGQPWAEKRQWIHPNSLHHPRQNGGGHG